MTLSSRWSAMFVSGLALAVASPALAGRGDRAAEQLPSIEQAEMLSPFGGRAAFSPDGKKIAFVGKTYGDAYEIDIATRAVRNLTRGFPHQGIMRIQYLPNGDFLVTAPRIHNGGSRNISPKSSGRGNG